MRFTEGTIVHSELRLFLWVFFFVESVVNWIDTESSFVEIACWQYSISFIVLCVVMYDTLCISSDCHRHNYRGRTATVSRTAWTGAGIALGWGAVWFIMVDCRGTGIVQ